MRSRRLPGRAVAPDDRQSHRDSGVHRREMSLLAGDGEAEPRCLVHDLQLGVAADPAFTAGLRDRRECALGQGAFEFGHGAKDLGQERTLG